MVVVCVELKMMLNWEASRCKESCWIGIMLHMRCDTDWSPKELMRKITI